MIIIADLLLPRSDVGAQSQSKNGYTVRVQKQRKRDWAGHVKSELQTSEYSTPRLSRDTPHSRESQNKWGTTSDSNEGKLGGQPETHSELIG